MMAALAKPPGTMRLMLTGDVMLGRGVDQILPHHCDPQLYEGYVTDARDYVALAVRENGPLPASRGPAYPWGIALQDMEDKSPDARVINLETAVTTSDEPWPYKGINYRMHPGNVPTLTAAKVDVAVLGNNHTLDWGREGLLETLESLQAAGLQTPGAGRDGAEAQRPAIVPSPAGDSRLLLWSVGHESSGVPGAWVAGPGRPGVFLSDFVEADVELLRDLVAAEKQPGDVAVVSVHMGSNWGYHIPGYQREFAHRLIDEAGVDLVHGHSSHHIKGAELYRGKLILYGCGDLISDYEGIHNSSIDSQFPHESHRDDVGLLWYADVSTANGTLAQLQASPARLKHLSLTSPDHYDWAYVLETLGRECRKGGFSGARRLPDGHTVALDFNAPAVVRVGEE